jgi:SAM-dependent methyltransferase
VADLRELKEVWEHLGRTDPYWAILSDPEKKGNRWDAASFFETGRREIKDVLSYLDSLGLKPSRRAALDFGCGVGRLTQALAEHYEQVTGVDIASSMIDIARTSNRHGERCRYLVNDRDDLSILENETFDLVYSNVTLQHMEPAYALRYIREFLRVLAPRGVAVFQLPSGRVSRETESRGRGSLKRAIRSATPPALLRLYRRIRHRVRALRGRMTFDCYEVARNEVLELLRANGASVRDVVEDGMGGPEVVSLRYCVTKG